MKNLKSILIGGIAGIAISLATYSAFNFLTKPKGLTEYIDRIYLIEKEDMPKKTKAYTYYDQETEKINIVLQKNYDKVSFFHEAGHAKYLYLDLNNSDFPEKWKQVADFKYGDLLEQINWNLGRTTLKSGILNEVSIMSATEDVANFVECLGYEETPEEMKSEGIETNGKVNENFLGRNTILYPLFFADTTDHRYKQKLDLLKEYNFLTKEEHEKLSKNLGSLNYLLKSGEEK